MTLQIEAGKYYRTRDGRKVGPMYERGGEWICDHQVDGYVPMWHLKTGVANFTTEGPESDDPQYDLIAEWTDDPAAREPELLDLAALAKMHGIRITVTIGEMSITYDGRE